MSPTAAVTLSGENFSVPLIPTVTTCILVPVDWAVAISQRFLHLRELPQVFLVVTYRMPGSRERQGRMLRTAF